MAQSTKQVQTLAYAHVPVGPPWWDQLPRWWRRPLLMAAFLDGAYIAAYFRTMSYGTSLRFVLAGFLLAALFAAPVIAAASFGLPWRRGVMRWVLVAMLCVAFAEILAGAQELKFAQKVSKTGPGAPASEDRWWPFGDHHIGYDGEHYYGQD